MVGATMRSDPTAVEERRIATVHVPAASVDHDDHDDNDDDAPVLRHGSVGARLVRAAGTEDPPLSPGLRPSSTSGAAAVQSSAITAEPSAATLGASSASAFSPAAATVSSASAGAAAEGGEQRALPRKSSMDAESLWGDASASASTEDLVVSFSGFVRPTVGAASPAGRAGSGRASPAVSRQSTMSAASMSPPPRRAADALRPSSSALDMVCAYRRTDVTAHVTPRSRCGLW
jgi:hypothetical protein